MFERFSKNPLLTPHDIEPSVPHHRVIGVFNPAAHRINGVTYLVLRVAEQAISPPDRISIPIYDEALRGYRYMEIVKDDQQYDLKDARVVRSQKTGRILYLTSVSYLIVAESTDGIHFTVRKRPLIDASFPYATYGVEDPRLTALEDKLYLTYSAVSADGVMVGLAQLNDTLTEAQPLGIILPPENKNAVLFPERIHNAYALLHRPVPFGLGEPNVYLAFSPDLVHWGEHRVLFRVRSGMWDSVRIGVAVPPLKTEYGWLVFYHGADEQGIYALGAVLLDLERPWRVLKRTRDPLIGPEAPYEKQGFYGGVVFPTGAIMEGASLILYYGAADTVVAGGRLSLKDVWNKLEPID